MVQQNYTSKHVVREKATRYGAIRNIIVRYRKMILKVSKHITVKDFYEYKSIKNSKLLEANIHFQY